jgi:putative (di)nucleoside polyphosphate hydrolase
VIDVEGYRANVGIILRNTEGKLLWARRIGQDAWQFPQGGIREDESPEEAMFRELHEEIGLAIEDVDVLGRTRDWLRYRLPRRHLRYHRKPLCIGQKQVWFLLNLITEETRVRFDMTEEPEFDRWRWVDYWYPLEEVVAFKRKVYESALTEFAPLVFPGQVSVPGGRKKKLT